MAGTEKTIPIYFDPVKVGASLKEVGIDYQEIESREIETRWFRDSQSETDVFVWMNKDKKMIKQQVSVMGLLTEWNLLDGVRTGVIMESEMSAHELMQNGLTPGDTASEVIHFDKKVQQRTLGMAISILKSMTCLEAELMDKMLKNFNQGVPFPDVKLPESLQKIPQNSLWLRVKGFISSCFKK